MRRSCCMTQKRTSRHLRNKYRLLLRTSIIIHPENAIALIRNLRHSFSHVALVAHRDPRPIHVQAAQCTCALRLFAKARCLGAWWLVARSWSVACGAPRGVCTPTPAGPFVLAIANNHPDCSLCQRQVARWRGSGSADRSCVLLETKFSTIAS